MKRLSYFIAICFALVISTSCDREQIIPGSGLTEDQFGPDARKGARVNPCIVNGSVEVLWKGANKGSDMGNKPVELLTFMDINAIEGMDRKDPRGELVYRVLETDSSLHREIKANVLDVFVDPDLRKGWIVAVVISDSKGCAGDGHSGHDEACGSGSDDHSSHDGGCSHDEPDDGGCSDDHTDDGGCSDDHTDDGGCSGSPDIHGGSPGGEDKGNPMSGKNCRLGQIIAMKVRDLGTPGVKGDHITWKWFDSSAYFVPEIANILDWPHLCKKEIINGNIVIHLP